MSFGTPAWPNNSYKFVPAYLFVNCFAPSTSSKFILLSETVILFISPDFASSTNVFSVISFSFGVLVSKIISPADIKRAATTKYKIVFLGLFGEEMFGIFIFNIFNVFLTSLILDFFAVFFN